VSLKLVIGLVLSAAQPVAAERSILADVPAIAPFDASELTAALRVRLAREGSPVTVRVLSTATGVRVEVSTTENAIERGGAREVALDGLTGETAARMVALAADDLMLDELALPPVEPRVAAPRIITVGVVGAGAAWDDLFGAVTLDVARARGSWLAALDLGGATLVGGPINLSAAVVRLSAGYRLGYVELRAGATFAPLVVSDGDGDSTVLVGGGASARLRIPLGGGLRAVLAAGVDVFATRTQYLVEGMPTLTTPRTAPWFGAGIEVAP